MYPKTFLGEVSVYDSAWWKWLVWVWEAAVYNPLLDLEAWGLPLAVAAVLAYLCRRWYMHRLRAWWLARRGAAAARGGVWRLARTPPRTKAGLDRDLDV